MRLFGQVVLAMLVACGGASEPTGSQNPGGGGQVIPPVVGFSKRTESASGLTIPFQVWAPQNFASTKKWPIVVALAGTGERGNDGEKQVLVGLGPLVKAQPMFPAVVIFPQIPDVNVGTAEFDVAVFRAIDDVIRDYNGDPDRVYLTGLSYGGTEGFTLLYNTPGRFAAFVDIAGGICSRCIQEGSTLSGAQTLVAQRLKSLPIWIFQGDQDPNTPVANTRALRDDFISAGSTSLKYTEYAGAGHIIWDQVYGTPAVWDWLFQQHR